MTLLLTLAMLVSTQLQTQQPTVQGCLGMTQRRLGLTHSGTAQQATLPTSSRPQRVITSMTHLMQMMRLTQVTLKLS